MAMRVLRLVTAGLLAFAALMFATADNPALVVLNIAAAGLNVLYFFLFAGFGVVLDPDGITVQGFNTRRLPWHQVRAIRPVRFLGDQRTQIVPVSGPSIRTYAPTHSWIAPDPDFDAKIAGMQQYHLAHTATPPPPQPFARPI